MLPFTVQSGTVYIYIYIYVVVGTSESSWADVRAIRECIHVGTSRSVCAYVCGCEGEHLVT